MPTFTYKVFSPLQFSSKSVYDAVYGSFQSLNEDMIVSYDFWSNYSVDLSGYNLILGPNGVRNYYNNDIILDHGIDIKPFNDNWQAVKYKFTSSFSEIIDLTDPNSFPRTPSEIGYCHFMTYSNIDLKLTYLFTTDGRSVKVWKSLDSYKAYSVGKSNIYYSKSYDSFDSSVDNSITFTGAYYNGDYSHDTIQNTIDNSQTIDESTVNNIVNNYITNNNYGDSSGSGGSGTGSGSGGWWNIGSGISSFIEGIASLLDFILKLLGDLVGLLGTFLTSVLDVLSGLTALGQGFGDFLGAAFSFLPEECISLIMSSIAAMCIAGVVRAFIK